MDSLDYLSLPHPRHCPTPAEIALSKGMIKDIEKEMESLKSEGQGLQNRLELLQQRRENHASYISGLRRLPMEILEDIIRICLDNHVQIATITQICGTIREVAHEMSSIWSRLRLDPLFSYRYHPWEGILCSTAEQVGFVLAHAGSKPLDLGIYHDTNPDMLDTIISHGSPIHSLIVDRTDRVRRSLGL
ncbi:hypothetical protein CPB86DRAFT_58159 [Serendipita vermifera]|nr:hypothetical protein CPB86DRAFT_58159 [Serendipita vermifera]